MELYTLCWDGKQLDKDFFIRCQASKTQIIVQFSAKLREIKSLDLSRVRVMMDSISEIGAPARQCMLFSLSGFDFDLRELAQIPEAVGFIRRVVEEFPHIFYFLHPEVNQHMFTALIPHTTLSAPLLIPSTKVVQLDIPAADAKLAEVSEAVTAYGANIGDERGARASIRQWRQTLNI